MIDPESNYNGKRLLIITCVYNNLSLVKDCIKSVAENTTGEFMHVLVYNYPDNKEILEYLEQEKITVLDPGKNIGCHRGFNFGFERSKHYNPDFIVKLDDDTTVPKNWNLPMMEVLEQEKNLAYLSSINKSAKQGSDFIERKIGKYTIEIPKSGVVGFSCVMFPAATLNQIGVLSKIKTLYGGEELDFLERVRDAGKFGGYIKEVIAFHAGNENRDYDYVLWKYVYGYLGFTNKDFIDFKKDRVDLIKYYTMWLDDENEDLKKIAKRRIGEIYET